MWLFSTNTGKFYQNISGNVYVGCIQFGFYQFMLVLKDSVNLILSSRLSGSAYNHIYTGRVSSFQSNYLSLLTSNELWIFYVSTSVSLTSYLTRNLSYFNICQQTYDETEIVTFCAQKQPEKLGNYCIGLGALQFDFLFLFHWWSSSYVA